MPEMSGETLGRVVSERSRFTFVVGGQGHYCTPHLKRRSRLSLVPPQARAFARAQHPCGHYVSDRGQEDSPELINLNRQRIDEPPCRLILDLDAIHNSA